MDLKQALLRAGLVDERTQKEADAAQHIEEEARLQSRVRQETERARRIGILEETSSPQVFRREAKKLLMMDPNLLPKIIDLAHARQMQRRKKQGGGRLIANLLQLRCDLKDLSDNERRSHIEKNFHKH